MHRGAAFEPNASVSEAFKRSRDVLQRDETHPGRHGRVVVAVHASYSRVHGTAHDEPHDQLDAFRASLLHELAMAEAREGERVALHVIQPATVPFFVDEPGAFAGQLMRQATCAEDRD